MLRDEYEGWLLLDALWVYADCCWLLLLLFDGVYALWLFDAYVVPPLLLDADGMYADDPPGVVSPEVYFRTGCCCCCC